MTIGQCECGRLTSNEDGVCDKHKRRYKYVWHIATYKDRKPSKYREISRQEALAFGVDCNRMASQARRLGEVYANVGLGGIYCTKEER